MTDTRSRVQPGVPTGGQYATEARAAADMTTMDLFGDEAPAPASVTTPIGRDWTAIDHAYGSLRDVDMERGNAVGANFQNADLRGARMAGIIADRADFTKADLTGADLANGSFVEAQFRDAALSGGSVDGADLSGSNMERAEIASADNANFSHACLAGATLSGHFQNCDFRGVDFRATQMGHPGQGRAVTFLDCEFDDDPIQDLNTAWPRDFDPQVNARFRSYGFDADDQARWESGNFYEPSDAATWRDAGFSPAEANTWASEGWERSGHAARPYRDAGLDAREANYFSNEDFDADEAVAWKAAGFDGIAAIPGEDVGSWRRTGLSPAAASDWADAHYISSEADQMIRDGHTDPRTAPAPMRHAGITAAYEGLKGTKIADARDLEKSLKANRASLGTGTEVEMRLRAVERYIRDRSRSSR